MTRPAITVSTLSTSPRETIAQDLDLSPNANVRDVVFELIRAIAWSSTLGRQTIGEHTLADRATSAALPLLDGAHTRVRNDITTAIEALEAVGDLTLVRGGQWLCTPAHRVEMPNAQSDILVCGKPLRVLPVDLRRNLRLHGPVRRIAKSAESPLPFISATTWQRRPTSPLPEWTHALLEMPDLASPDTDVLATANYHFYLPTRSGRGTQQHARWHLTGTDLNGRYLSRVRSLTGSLAYQVVELDQGGVVGVKEIDTDTARRLMYGIDNRAGRPTQAVRRRDKEDVRLTTTNPLPHAEARMLYTSATRIDGRHWVLPADHAHECPELSDLCITVVDDPR